ncbi:Eftud2 protein [Culex quinquefasciatus]|uniref:Eftud2 protein n=1 Tax=Culex quinquefasciatus TaxID=7176 RepID=B0WCZ7_CULQU|nr:Eftud2 protein [Culex quinquefasciatus]|eukprot:XP_001846581.1 Eftud2 protein [Culex quinquefasciatus]
MPLILRVNSTTVKLLPTLLKFGNGAKRGVSIEATPITLVLPAVKSYGICFTKKSFGKLYTDVNAGVSAGELARKLWGDMYFHNKSWMFKNKPPHSSAQRSVVEFILEPLQKLFAQVVRDVDTTLADTLTELNMCDVGADYERDVACRAGGSSAECELLARGGGISQTLQVERLWIYEACYKVELNRVQAGNSHRGNRPVYPQNHDHHRTHNKKYKITMIAEPLEKDLAEDIKSESV